LIGGCFCNKIRVSYNGEPVTHALCHCLDCRKISGATYSDNIIVKEEQFKLESGTPKELTKIADSGKPITSYFCGDCGTTLYRRGDNFPGQVLIKAGVLDDPNWVNQNTPNVELFNVTRVNWFPAIEGAGQVAGMP